MNEKPFFFIFVNLMPIGSKSNKDFKKTIENCADGAQLGDERDYISKYYKNVCMCANNFHIIALRVRFK